MARKNRPHTPDGRYLVARGLLKRSTNPNLDESTRRKSVKQLMQARMANNNEAVSKAKIALGEAGPVWWDDDSPDYSGQPPVATPYSEWWFGLSDSEREAGTSDRKL